MEVLDGYLRQIPRSAIERKCEEVIKDALKSITIPDLRSAAIRSLRSFYRRQILILRAGMEHRLLVYLALLTATGTRKRPVRNGAGNVIFYTAAGAKRFLSTQSLPNPFGMGDSVKERYSDGAPIYGVPLKEYAKTYTEKYVRPVLDRLCDDFPPDPDDQRSNFKRRNSLRNRAEMEVRYNGHLESIRKFSEEGVKLVIASTHADCSERCKDYQGRVYSLDGTSGVTDDGRKYVPLEEATDIYYTTAAGKVYKNGLLGFNCRHYLIEYKTGLKPPQFSEREEMRQRSITETQRRLERTVRRWRISALEAKKAGDTEKYKVAYKNDRIWTKRYIEYCQKNQRAYYPSRISVI